MPVFYIPSGQIQQGGLCGGGLPLLNGAIAFFVCRVQQYDAGDHVILIGEKEKYDHLDGDPLVFHSGEYLAVTRRTEFTE
jgi:flavin reductase (DIM6/NTAB) family NADH-FMN oxidoreductase RutF